MKEVLLKNWKSTLIGFAQLVNGLIPAVQVLLAAIDGVFDAKHLAVGMAVYLFINSFLQQLKGLVTKDADKGSDRPQPVVDQKLDNVPPVGQ